MGGIAIAIDSEMTLNKYWLKQLGLNIDKRLLIMQPETLEETLEMIAETIRKVKSLRKDIPVVILWDSLPASRPKIEITGEYGDGGLGLQARMMSQSLPKLVGLLSKEKVALVIINQYREKIGVMFGSKNTTPGGRALGFYASLRIELTAYKKIERDGKIIGMQGRAVIKKNKLATPFGEATYNLYFDRGIDNVSSYLPIAIELGMVKKVGGWYSIGDNKFRKGEAEKYLGDVEKQIRERLK